MWISILEWEGRLGALWACQSKVTYKEHKKGTMKLHGFITQKTKCKQKFYKIFLLPNDYYKTPQFVVDVQFCHTVCHPNKSVWSASGQPRAWAAYGDFSPATLSVLLCQTCPDGLQFLFHLSPHGTDPHWLHSKTGTSTILFPAMSVCGSKQILIFVHKQKIPFI